MTSSILRIEEAAMNAWPSTHQMVLDGWVLRFNGGFTRRANSVHPFYAGTRTLDEKIIACERAYAARRLPTTFKLTDAAQPGDLDAQLEARGYTNEAGAYVMTREICGSADLAPGGDAVRLWHEASSEWLQAYIELFALPTEREPIVRNMFAGMSMPRLMASLIDGGRTVACGMAVVEEEFMGVFGVATHADYRRRGYATRLMEHLLAWGREQGARTVYLQVMQNNAVAIEMYKRLGFNILYSHWYRVQPT